MLHVFNVSCIVCVFNAHIEPFFLLMACLRVPESALCKNTSRVLSHLKVQVHLEINHLKCFTEF